MKRKQLIRVLEWIVGNRLLNGVLSIGILCAIGWSLMGIGMVISMAVNKVIGWF